MSWRCSKQYTVADSTTKVEYIVASEASKEGVWVKNFIFDLGVVESVSKPLDLYCDNSGAIAQVKEPRNNHKTQHILRRVNLICDIVEGGDVNICKVHTNAKFVDPLTKPLPRPKHGAHMSSMGI